MIAKISYLYIFAGMFSSLLLTFAPYSFTYKSFVFSIDLITLPFIVYNFVNLRSKKLVVKNLAIYMLFIALFEMTSVIYGEVNGVYHSFELVLIGQILPIILAASIASQNENILNQIKKYAPIVGVFFSILSIYSAVNPSLISSNGLAETDSGLDYQSISYLASYGAGFCLYYQVSFKKIEWHWLFRQNITRILIALLIFTDFFAILISGGRGGLVVFIFILILSTFLYTRYSSGKAFTPRLLIFSAISIALGILFFNRAAIFQSETNGFLRILAFLQERDDELRGEIRNQAFEIISDNSIYGHGIGSVFYTLGYYSHNCFTDILIEAGIVGLSIYLYIIYQFFKKVMIMIKHDLSNSIWMYMFLFNLIMSLFSGYYMAMFAEVFSVIIVLYQSRRYTNKRR